MARAEAVRLILASKFPEAVGKFTEALEGDPKCAILLCGRARAHIGELHGGDDPNSRLNPLAVLQGRGS